MFTLQPLYRKTKADCYALFTLLLEEDGDIEISVRECAGYMAYCGKTYAVHMMVLNGQVTYITNSLYDYMVEHELILPI